MRPPPRSFPAVLAACALLLAALPAPSRAQAPGAWRLEAGGGIALLTGGHDRTEAGQAAPAARAVVERALDGGLGVGAEWWAAWPASRLAGGRERRHHVGLLLTWRPRAWGPVVSVGAGPTLATVIDQDGPPEPPGVGDAVIGVGDTTGLGVTVSGGWELDVSGIALLPRIGFLVQRAGGHTLSHLSGIVSVVPGG